MRKVLLGVAIAAAALSPPLKAEVKILFNAYEPPSGGNTVAAKAWMKEVERVTEGRVSFEMPANTLAPPPRQWELVTSGVADAVYFLPSRMADTLRLPQLAGLPLMGATAEATAVALWRTHEKYFQQADEYREVELIGYCAAPPLTLMARSEEVPTALSDVRGMRVQSIQQQVPVLEALGMVPVVAPSTTSHDQLSSGTVEGAAAMSFYVAEAFNVTRYLNSFLDVPGGLVTATFAFLINKNKWDQIPERDQALIRSVSGERFGEYCRYWDEQEQRARGEWDAAGKAVAEPGPEMMDVIRRVSREQQEHWIQQAATRGVDGEAALAFFREQLAAAQKNP